MVRIIASPHGKNIKSLASGLRARVSYLWLVWYLPYMNIFWRSGLPLMKLDIKKY